MVGEPRTGDCFFGDSRFGDSLLLGDGDGEDEEEGGFFDSFEKTENE